MSDIFISYSSADRPRAALVAQALTARGWSIWWDRTIPPGRQFDDVIEEALDAARCVVVLWSKASTASSWVRNEASEALQRKALIPALIDVDVKIPLEFRRLQAADLTRWNGEPSTPEFEQFCAAIASEVGRGGAAPVAGPSPASVLPPAAAPSPAPEPSFRPVPAAGPSAPSAPLPRPPPAPAVAPTSGMTTTTRNKKAWWIAGGVLLLLVIGAAMSDRNDVDKAAFPQVRPGAPFTANDGQNGGIRAELNWRDDVLAYSGSVAWDGRSSTAFIRVAIADGNTRQAIGTRDLTAGVMRTGPAQIVLTTSVGIPGDSRTPGPHSHNINLVFESQGGPWQFMRNCMAPNDCY